jgi:hypothetical protein
VRGVLSVNVSVERLRSVVTNSNKGRAEEIRVEAEHLSAEADKLTAELKRRRQ